MNAMRKTAILVGVLFIIATAFLFIGGAVYNPILDAPDVLKIAHPRRVTVITGMLLEFVCVLAIPLIAVFLFPVLSRHGAALAVGYVGFRFFEAVLFAAEQINKLLLIDVSRGALGAGSGEGAFFHDFAGLVQARAEWLFAFYVLVFCAGALLLYAALYRSKLTPRFISVWGLLAAVLLLTGTVIIMFGAGSETPARALAPVFFLPIAVNEMVLALWLIIRGFNPAALEPGAA